jgi:hypothetical protein
MMVGPFYGEHFRSKTPLFDFLLNIEKMAKNAVKRPELGFKGLAAQILLGLF